MYNAQRFARDSRDFLFLCGHDPLQRGVAHFVDAGLNRKNGRKRTFHPLKPSGFEFAFELHLSVLHFDLHDDGGVRTVEQRSKQNASLAKTVVVALQPGEHEISFFFLNGGRKCFRGTQRIELREIVIGNMNRAVRALRQRFLDGLLHALRAHRKSDYFAAVLFLEAKSFFERVAVRLVHLEADVGFLDPVSGDGQRRVFRRNLLDAHDDVHEDASFRDLPK